MKYAKLLKLRPESGSPVLNIHAVKAFSEYIFNFAQLYPEERSYTASESGFYSLIPRELTSTREHAGFYV